MVEELLALTEGERGEGKRERGREGERGEGKREGGGEGRGKEGGRGRGERERGREGGERQIMCTYCTEHLYSMLWQQTCPCSMLVQSRDWP